MLVELGDAHVVEFALLFGQAGEQISYAIWVFDVPQNKGWLCFVTCEQGYCAIVEHFAKQRLPEIDVADAIQVDFVNIRGEKPYI